MKPKVSETLYLTEQYMNQKKGLLASISISFKS